MCYLIIHMPKLRLWKADSLLEECCIQFPSYCQGFLCPIPHR
jgi:hypothetical protein